MDQAAPLDQWVATAKLWQNYRVCPEQTEGEGGSHSRAVQHVQVGLLPSCPLAGSVGAGGLARGAALESAGVRAARWDRCHAGRSQAFVRSTRSPA